jgi:hypothetical protein
MEFGRGSIHPANMLGQSLPWFQSEFGLSRGPESAEELDSRLRFCIAKHCKLGAGRDPANVARIQLAIGSSVRTLGAAKVCDEAVTQLPSPQLLASQGEVLGNSGIDDDGCGRNHRGCAGTGKKHRGAEGECNGHVDQSPMRLPSPIASEVPEFSSDSNAFGTCT